MKANRFNINEPNYEPGDARNDYVWDPRRKKNEDLSPFNEGDNRENKRDDSKSFIPGHEKDDEFLPTWEDNSIQVKANKVKKDKRSGTFSKRLKEAWNVFKKGFTTSDGWEGKNDPFNAGDNGKQAPELVKRAVGTHSLISFCNGVKVLTVGTDICEVKTNPKTRQLSGWRQIISPFIPGVKFGEGLVLDQIENEVENYVEKKDGNNKK